jgi:hypothetical protein
MPFPINLDQVRHTEIEIGVSLPSAYVAQMLTRNGGTVEAAGDDWDLYPIRDASDRKRLARTCNHILRETKEAAKWDGFPEGALAIAGNGCGDHLVFMRNPDGRSFDAAVYIWDHETGETEPIAPAFSSLKPPAGR